MLIFAQVKAKARGKEKPRRHKWKGCTANAERTYWQISPDCAGRSHLFCFQQFFRLFREGCHRRAEVSPRVACLL